MIDLSTQREEKKKKKEGNNARLLEEEVNPSQETFADSI